MVSLKLLCAATAAAVFCLDRATKAVFGSVKLQLIPGLLEICPTSNSGGLFGLGQGLNGLLALASLGAIVAILFWLRQLTPDSVSACATGALLGGLAGNALDRIAFGAVLDWIKPSFWPAFNIADAGLVLGIAGLAGKALFKK